MTPRGRLWAEGAPPPRIRTPPACRTHRCSTYPPAYRAPCRTAAHTAHLSLHHHHHYYFRPYDTSILTNGGFSFVPVEPIGTSFVRPDEGELISGVSRLIGQADPRYGTQLSLRAYESTCHTYQNCASALAGRPLVRHVFCTSEAMLAKCPPGCAALQKSSACVQVIGVAW